MEQRFDLSNMVMIPLSYFHRLVRCYYGEGPKDGEEPAGYVKPEPQSPASSNGGGILDETVLARIFQSDMTPRGAAARKIKEREPQEAED